MDKANLLQVRLDYTFNVRQILCHSFLTETFHQIGLLIRNNFNPHYLSSMMSLVIQHVHRSILQVTLAKYFLEKTQHPQPNHAKQHSTYQHNNQTMPNNFTHTSQCGGNAFCLDTNFSSAKTSIASA